MLSAQHHISRMSSPNLAVHLNLALITIFLNTDMITALMPAIRVALQF